MNNLKIKIFSYDHRLLDSFTSYLFNSAKSVYEVKGPIPLPTKRELFSVCRSPFAHKVSMEQFERLTHKRLIYIKGDEKSITTFLKSITIPAGVSMELA